MAITFNRTIYFRDNKINRWEVTIEVRTSYRRINKNGKWVTQEGPLEASFTGEGCGGSGQIYDSIKPRTNNQWALLNAWKQYHLSTDLPENYSDYFNQLCKAIETEEAQYTQSIGPIFDMSAKDFKATPELVHQVAEMRRCSTCEAKHFIALGMHLGVTYGDLNESFESLPDCDNYYTAFGAEYYIGTDDELTQVAQNLLDQGEYNSLWREAVATGETEDGLHDWLNGLLTQDGWINILNHWDGKYYEYKVLDDYICVSHS